MNRGHQIENDVINHIFFVGGKVNQSRYKKNIGIKYETLNLFASSYKSEIFKLLPKNYTISTNNGSYLFNLEILRDSSPVISKIRDEDPTNFHYHFNINDDQKVFQKFEQLYQGDIVQFTADDIPISQLITKTLDMKYFPNYLKLEPFRFYENTLSPPKPPEELNYAPEIYDGVVLDDISLRYFLQDRMTRSFTIKTNKNNYQCNFYGVFSSKIIKSAFDVSNSDTFYYDFEDNFDEFQVTCDYFNFCDIRVTNDNIFSIQEIAKNLKIDELLSEINEIFDNHEIFEQEINENQIIIDSYDHLFELLYHIKENKIEEIKEFIINSK